MTVRKSVLGKGLDTLIPNMLPSMPERGTEKPGRKSVEDVRPQGDRSEDTLVQIALVEPNREQPRKEFEEDALLELADSIRQYGVLQPLLVQKRKDYYEIIAGERRWRAAKLAGLKEVPVRIKEFSEQEILEISLIENLQREDLNPIEEALAYQRLLKEFRLKQDEVAERVSKSRTAVTNSLRLLKLDDKVQQMVVADMITTGHARALLAIEDPQQQSELAQQIFDQKLSVRETESLIKALKNPKRAPKKQAAQKTDIIYKDLEGKMRDALGTKVKIRQAAKGKGKIEIDYYSAQELERIYDLLTSLSEA